MRIDSSLKRMDSLMVAFNIKRMGRLELLYTCVANLAKEMAKTREIPEHLRHYTEADDIFFGCKIGALNIKKFCRYMQDQDKCAPKMVTA